MTARRERPPHDRSVPPRSELQPAGILKGWAKIAAFLGQPVSVAQRWAKNGMPVTHEGRSVVAASAELTSWLGKESGGEPVHVADPEADLAVELKRGLAFVRREKKR
jgi:hypothetical protein